MKIAELFACLCATALIGAPAFAQEWYVSGSVSYANPSDSDNSGTTGAFTTGNLGDGTAYGWTTAFDTGSGFNIEAGARYGTGLRSGLEISYTKADVETHKGVNLGGGSIDALDAASIAGSPTPLGASVAAIVADGRGDVSSTSVFANVYYDFNSAST